LQSFAIDAAGRVTMQASLVVAATDQDQDDLAFTWNAPGCPDAVLTTRSEHGEGAEASQSSEGGGWRSHLELVASADSACEVRVEVRDFWEGGRPPAGSGLPPERGGVASGSFKLAPAPHLGEASTP